MATVIVIVAIFLVVGIDFFLKQRKKNSKKELLVVDGKSKKFKSFSLYFLIFAICLGYGFFDFYHMPQKQIDKINQIFSKFELSYKEYWRDDTDHTDLFSKSDSIISELNKKLFVFQDYSKLILEIERYKFLYENRSMGDFMYSNLNYFNYWKNKSRRKGDSIRQFRNKLTNFVKETESTISWGKEFLELGKIGLMLYEMTAKLGYDETFYISNVEDLDLKNKFISALENYANVYKDDLNTERVEILKIIILPGRENITNYIGDLSIKKNIKKLSDLLFIFGKGSYDFSLDNNGVDKILYEQVETLIKNYLAGYHYGPKDESILKNYFHTNPYIYSTGGVNNYGKLKYKNLKYSKRKKIRNDIKELVVNAYGNDSLSIDFRGKMTYTLARAAENDKVYADMILANKELLKLSAIDETNDKIYGFLYTSYTALASYNFDKDDFLGAITNHEKALEYIDKSDLTFKDESRSLSLRNLFASKWNYKKNGDKMGACEDLRTAADLNPKEYYNYYVKNCAE